MINVFKITDILVLEYASNNRSASWTMTFRLLKRPITTHFHLTLKSIQAMVILHNILISKQGPAQEIVPTEMLRLQPITRQSYQRASNSTANEIRHTTKAYFTFKNPIER